MSYIKNRVVGEHSGNAGITLTLFGGVEFYLFTRVKHGSEKLCVQLNGSCPVTVLGSLSATSIVFMESESGVKLPSEAWAELKVFVQAAYFGGKKLDDALKQIPVLDVRVARPSSS